MAAVCFPAFWLDTITRMAVSNIVEISTIFATAATLHASGVTDTRTSSKAAEALRPIAGVLTFAVCR